MKFKVKKSIICIICILSILFMIQIPVQAAVIDTADQKAADNSGVIAGNYDINATALSPDVNLPSVYSSRDIYTTAVRNQIGNTCWAYSAMASLETLILKNGDRGFLESVDENLHLSPMHLNYFATSQNSKGWLRDYTSGGYSLIPMGYLASWSGAKAEKDFPDSTPYDNFTNLDAKAKTVAGVNSIMYLDGSDRDAIKTAIYEYGSVVGSYYDYVGFYNASTYSYYWDVNGPDIDDLDYSQLGHAVCVVGWDDNYDKSKFKDDAQPDENGAWLCKNSWGETSRDHGYFWISYEDAYLFDDIFGYCYALMDYQQPDENTKLYQNENYGATYEFEYIEDLDDLTYINVFDFNDNYTVLDKINFESTSQGAEYSIYYIPLDSSSVPNSDQSTWTELYTGEVEYCGYISVDIDDFTVNNGKGAIGIRFQNDASNDAGNTVGVCEWLSDSNDEMVFVPETQKGACYIVGYEEEPMDLMDFYLQEEDDDIGGTFVIKAIAKKKNIIKGDVDGDGLVTIDDAIIIQRYLARLYICDEYQLQAADFDDDDVVTIQDVTMIQRYLARLI